MRLHSGFTQKYMKKRLLISLDKQPFICDFKYLLRHYKDSEFFLLKKHTQKLVYEDSAENVFPAFHQRTGSKTVPGVAGATESLFERT